LTPGIDPTKTRRRPCETRTRNRESPLPGLYAAWIADILGGPIPSESEATCSACAMRPGSECDGAEADFFHADTKCCTYLPELPNFLVGRILADEDPSLSAGKRSVEARLGAGLAVTPLGLGVPPVHRLLYQRSMREGFGRSRALRCPHYVEETGGSCGIWRHRNGVCATWFCKHVRGAVGARFWRQLAQLLGGIEWALARSCVLELGLDAEALEALLVPRGAPEEPGHLTACETDGIADPAASRRLWGDWWGREREFYDRCARLVNRLRWDAVASIAGPDVRALARVAGHGYHALTSQAVAARLVPGPLRVTPIGPEATRVTTYRPYDPLAVPNTVLKVLSYFDGRPTGEVLRRIREATGITLPRALVRKLTDFEILVPPR
jgi:hypothetical protein